MENAFAQQKFPRLYGIYALSDRKKENNCLHRLSELNPDSDGSLLYEYFENLFQRIDQDNWEVFKQKLSDKVFGAHGKAGISIKGKMDKEEHFPIYPRFQGFDYFNEVHGYLYLKNRIHCEEATFLQEGGENSLKTPDLKGTRGTSVMVLEVKTINTSDDLTANWECVEREKKKTPKEKSIDLDYPKPEEKILEGLRCKIRSDIEGAKAQMADSHGARKIVLFVIDLDNNNIREGLRKYLEEVDGSHKELQIVAGLQSLWRPQNSCKEDLEWLYDK